MVAPCKLGVLVSLCPLKIMFPFTRTVLIFFIAGLLFIVPRARRTLGAYRIPRETGLLPHLVNSSSESVAWMLGQLHSLPALLNELGNQSGPSSLVARSNASAIVAMKVLMEIDEVAPVWIVLKFLEPAINWAMSIA
jgi:hypothetical protein